jgi:hypothetical protein
VSGVRLSAGAPLRFLSLIRTVIVVLEVKNMELIFFAWFSFMLGIGIMLTICSFGEWGHIPVSLGLAIIGWIFIVSKLL